MAQLVTRIDDSLAEQIDDLIHDGVARSRSDAVRIGLEQLIDRHGREKIGNAISVAYRRLPQTDGENAGIQEATRALVEEEPW
jgi:Arc/MetJ-type ribon-helix-helix transcriptional regulator